MVILNERLLGLLAAGLGRVAALLLGGNAMGGTLSEVYSKSTA